MPQELEARVGVQMLDVALRPREEIVNADDLVPLLDQAIDEVRTKEARTASHKYALAALVKSGHRASASHAGLEGDDFSLLSDRKDRGAADRVIGDA